MHLMSLWHTKRSLPMLQGNREIAYGTFMIADCDCPAAAAVR